MRAGKDKIMVRLSRLSNKGQLKEGKVSLYFRDPLSEMKETSLLHSTFMECLLQARSNVEGLYIVVEGNLDKKWGGEPERLGFFRG